MIEEAERNLRNKLPGALATFRLLVERSLRIVPSPPVLHSNPIKGWPIPRICRFWSRQCWLSVRGWLRSTCGTISPVPPHSRSRRLENSLCTRVIGFRV